MEQENQKYKAALYENIRKFVVKNGKEYTEVPRDETERVKPTIRYDLPQIETTPTLFCHMIGVSSHKIHYITYCDCSRDNEPLYESIGFHNDEVYGSNPMVSLYHSRFKDEYHLYNIHTDKLEKILNFLVATKDFHKPSE